VSYAHEQYLVQWTTDWTDWSFIFTGENHGWWRLL